MRARIVHATYVEYDTYYTYSSLRAHAWEFEGLDGSIVGSARRARLLLVRCCCRGGPSALGPQLAGAEYVVHIQVLAAEVLAARLVFPIQYQHLGGRY